MKISKTTYYKSSLNFIKKVRVVGMDPLTENPKNVKNEYFNDLVIRRWRTIEKTRHG